MVLREGIIEGLNLIRGWEGGQESLAKEVTKNYPDEVRLKECSRYRI